MNQYDHLKNKLHHYKVDIDKDKLWKNTSHAIPKRKRRPAVLIMLFAGLVFSGWLLYSSLLPLPESRSSLNSTQNINPDQLAQNLQVNLTENRDDVEESQSNTIEVVSSKLSDSVAKLISEKYPSGSDHTFNSKTEVEKIFLIDTREQNENIQTASLSATLMQINNIIQPLSEMETENSDKQYVQVVVPTIPTQQEGSFIIMHQTEYDLKNSIPEVDGPVDYLIKNISQIPMTTYSVAESVTHPNIQPLKGKFLQSIQMVQGIGFTSMKIHSLKPESAQFVAELKEKMSSLEILSTSATATFRLPAEFSLETGLQWTQLSTVIDHTWDTNERISQEGITTIIIDENGIPRSVTGSIAATRISHHHAKRFSEHQYMDLILALHKEIWNAKRLSVNAFVKGAYNLSYQAKGTILTAGGELIGFSKADNPFVRNALFALGGGLQINYHLYPHWILTGSLTFDQADYQYKDPNIPIRFQHSGCSSGLGVGYIF